MNANKLRSDTTKSGKPVSRDDAVRRHRELVESDDIGDVEEFEFDEIFAVYDAWSVS